MYKQLLMELDKKKFAAMFTYFRLQREHQVEKNSSLEVWSYRYFLKILTSPMALNEGSNGVSTALTLKDGENDTLSKVISNKDLLMLKKANDLIIEAENDCKTLLPFSIDLRRIKNSLRLAIEYKTKVLVKYFGHANFPDIEHIHSVRGTILETCKEICDAKQDFLKCVDILLKYPHIDTDIIVEMFYKLLKSVCIPSPFREDLRPISQLYKKVLDLQIQDPSLHVFKIYMYEIIIDLQLIANDRENALFWYHEAKKYFHSIRKTLKKDDYHHCQYSLQMIYFAQLVEKKEYLTIISHPIKVKGEYKRNSLCGQTYSQFMGYCHYNLGNYRDAMIQYEKSLNYKCLEHNTTFCSCNTSWIGLVICSKRIKSKKDITKHFGNIVNWHNGYQKIFDTLRKTSIQPVLFGFFHCLKTKSAIYSPCGKCGTCHACTSCEMKPKTERIRKESHKWRMFKNTNMLCYFVKKAFCGTKIIINEDFFVML